MNYRLFILASLLLLTFTLAAGEKAVQAGEDLNGKEIALKAGGRLDLTLAANPTTGFAWDVVEGLGGVLRQEGEPEYRASKPDAKKVGSGGTTTFHFKAAGPGTARLRLIYHRRWEKDVPPPKSFDLTVTVSAS